MKNSDRTCVYGKEAEQENEFPPEGKAGGWKKLKMWLLQQAHNEN